MFDGITHWLDVIAKWAAGFLAVLFVLNILFPPVTVYTKVFYAWRFGVTGVVKYQLGSEKNDQKHPERKPTQNGNLYLLNKNPIGQREWDDLSLGDVLQAKSKKNLRLEDDCGSEERLDCGSSPRIFTLEAGECVVVFSQMYEDNSTSSKLKDVSGGWLRVGTTSCGLFN